jgi:hypothetical protein
VQREIGHGIVVSASYLGSFGSHLQNFTDLNLAAPGTPYGTNLLVPSTITYTVNNVLSGNTVARMPVANGSTVTVPFYTSRLNSTYGAVIDIYSGASSNYNAFVFQVEKRMSNHVQMAMNYTWSHALDNGVNGTTGAASTPSLIDPANKDYSVYGNSIYNVPNRLTINALLEAPWHHSGALKYVLDGWHAAPMMQMQNGLPYSAQTASATPAQYVGIQKFTGVSTGMLGSGGSFQIPGTERDGWRQPPTYVGDLRLSKQFPVYEQYKLEFSADVFNIFNHSNATGINTSSAYSISNPSSGTATTVNSPTLLPNSNAVVSNSSMFGVPSSANSNFVYSTRQIQFGLRLTF